MRTPDDNRPADPHSDGQLFTAGPSPKDAAATVVLVHGRGAHAESMLELFRELDVGNIAAIAPQASGFTWYPQSFLAPLKMNQPYLDSALKRLAGVVDDLISLGISAKQIVLMGFSQGACLSLEFAARNPRRYGAVIGLTGGLIGPPGTLRDYAGSLAGTKVFLGTSDPDPHVPFERVVETQTVLERMAADVELRRYPGMGHTINEDELEVCRAILRAVSTKSERQK